MDRSSRRGRFFGCIAFLLVLTLICPANYAWSLTYEEERKLGKKTYELIKSKMKLVDDPVVNDYVDGLGRKILANIPNLHFDYHFSVIDHGVINAFATPAGYIYIHSETIMSMTSEGQLAAILAHEIAHVTSRHISERIDKSKKLNVATLGGLLAGILLGGAAGQALMAGSMAGGIQAQLAFSRQDEREADHKGLDYLVGAGYDPRYMIEAFSIMLNKAYASSDSIPTYLTTHPGLSDRIITVEALMTGKPQYSAVRGRGDDKAFRAIKNRVLATLSDTNRAQNYFNHLLKKNPNSAEAHYGLGIIALRKQNYNEAIGELKLALKAEPANASYMADLGTVLYHKKDYDGAIKMLSQALVLRPKNTTALYYLGRIYEDRGDVKKARELYSRLLLENPDHSDGLYRQGMIYGRQGDLARGHLHTGLHFKIEGQYDKALYHLKKAKENARSAPPEIQRRIDETLSQIKPKKKGEKDKKDKESREKSGEKGGS